MTDKSPNSYTKILKSSSLIGGSQGVNLLLGMVRMKFAAVFIGPLGVGLVGTYMSIQSMIGTMSGLGIHASAVRDVADAVGKGDEEQIGKTILTLRRISLFTGFFGALAMILLAQPLSEYTFNTEDYTLDISLLGITIFFSNIQGGQTALIKGMRRIGNLARLNIIGAVSGTLVTIVFYTWLGVRGIIPALLALAFIQFITSWYFARKVEYLKVEMSWRESIRASGGMVRLGLVFMWSGLAVYVVAYLTRVFITQEVSLEAVGIYSAAFALSGMFINFILGAMEADFYPRLTGVNNDHGAMARLVNEQTEIGLLLAIPGLLATLTLSPWIIRLFYTGGFLPAADLLQWFILGCLGRVISWPMGFIMLALGKGKWFFATETIFSFLHLGMIWLGLRLFGLEGVSVAFFLLYVIYSFSVYGVSRYLIQYKLNSGVRRLFYMLFPVVVLAFLTGRFLSILPATVFGVIITFVVSVYCLRGLVNRIGKDNRLVKKLCRIPGVSVICGI